MNQRAQELHLEVATTLATAESRLRRIALELAEENTDGLVDGLASYRDAVLGELRAAMENVNESADRSGTDALDVCQSIQDALDVLEFAIERNPESGSG